MPADEAQIIRAAQGGDEGAILALVDRYQHAVYRFGRRMCPTESDAEDVVQETLLTAVQKIGSFRGEASFTSWLFAIVRSGCSKRQRALIRQPVLEPIEQIDHGPAPDEVLSRQRLRAALDTALSTIDPMYREVLLLRDVEGMTAPEVGAALDLSVAAVKSRLHRARAMLRERVERILEPEMARNRSPAGEGAELGLVLSQYLEGELTRSQCEEIEARLAESPECRGACEVLRRLLGECKSCRLEQPPESLTRRVRSAIQELLRSSS